MRDHQFAFTDRSSDRVELLRQRLELADVFFFSKWSFSLDCSSCAPLADRTNGSCASSIAKQMVANALRFFHLNVPWSISITQRSSFTSPLTISYRSRSSSTICFLNVHE